MCECIKHEIKHELAKFLSKNQTNMISKLHVKKRYIIGIKPLALLTCLLLDLIVLVSLKIDLILIRVFYVVKVVDKMNRNEV